MATRSLKALVFLTTKIQEAEKIFPLCSREGATGPLIGLSLVRNVLESTLGMRWRIRWTELGSNDQSEARKIGLLNHMDVQDCCGMEAGSAKKGTLGKQSKSCAALHGCHGHSCHRIQH